MGNGFIRYRNWKQDYFISEKMSGQIQLLSSMLQMFKMGQWIP